MSSEITHIVLAVDEDGNKLFTVDECYSKEQAIDSKKEADEHHKENPHLVSDEVHEYEIRNA